MIEELVRQAKENYERILKAQEPLLERHRVIKYASPMAELLFIDPKGNAQFGHFDWDEYGDISGLDCGGVIPTSEGGMKALLTSIEQALEVRIPIYEMKAEQADAIALEQEKALYEELKAKFEK